MESLAVSVNAQGVRVEPGTPATFTVEVRNLGSVVDRYTCEIIGIDRSWWTVSPPSLEVFPQRGEDHRIDAPPTTGRFTVTIHAPRTSAATAGDWTIGAKVTSEHDSGVRLVEEAAIRFLPFGALSASLEPSVSEARLRATPSLILANRGNRTERVGLTGGDRARKLRFGFGAPEVALAPGEETEFPVRISIEGPTIVGGSTARPYSITAAPIGTDTPPVSVSGTLDQRPIVPTGLPAVLATTLALGLGGFAVYSAFLRPAPSPTPLPSGELIGAVSTPSPSPTPELSPSPSPSSSPSPSASPSPESSASPSPSPEPSPSPSPSPPSPIDVAYDALGGPVSFLGRIVTPLTALSDGGSRRDYEFGSIYLAPGATEAFALQRDLRDFWNATLGGTTGTLGYPTSHSTPYQTDGWAAGFQRGRAWWTPAAGGDSCTGLACLRIVEPLPSFIIISP